MEVLHDSAKLQAMSMPITGSACQRICTGCQTPYLDSHLLPDHLVCKRLTCP